MKRFREEYFEYLGVVALWILIFGKNVFSNLFFVDYVPARAGYLENMLVAGDFTGSINVVNLLRELFGIIGIERLFFSFMILFGMLVSYYFISALIKRFPKSLIAKSDDAAELRGIEPNLAIRVN